MKGLIVLIVMLWVSPAWAQLICHGQLATIEGTDLSETIHGTPGDDVIHAGEGDDRIFGGDGDDVICTGLGHDTVYGQRGDDLILSSDQDFLYKGGDGEDTCNEAEHTNCEDTEPVRPPESQPDAFTYAVGDAECDYSAGGHASVSGRL